jgi:flagellar motility protein MotE (MotC chaperone)
MKLGMKQLALVVLIAIVSFPLTYVIALFAAGNIKIELKKPDKGQGGEGDNKVVQALVYRDSLSKANMKSYQALVREREALAREKEQFKAQQERLALLEGELKKEREQIALEREKLEKMIQESKVATEKRNKLMARIYAGMKPAEAARVLETQDDEQVMQILNGISDDRQRSKIFAALSSEKAGRLTKKMGSNKL